MTNDGLIESALESLGVEIARVGEREITAYCPVHHLTVGRKQSHPKWYMNLETTAAICFTCGWRGNLARLVDDLEADIDLDEIQMDQAVRNASRLTEDDEEEVEEEDEESFRVSEYAFNKYQYPPAKELRSRKITQREAVRLNIRWDGKHWMLPIYDVSGRLLGWQEKSPGYFMNVPDRVRKRNSLFGLQASTRGKRVSVVESPLDAARFLRYGHNAVATYGAAVSDLQLEAVVKNFNEIVLAFDNDDAGLDATQHVAERIERKWGKNVRVLYFPYPQGSEGMDPGDFNDLQFWTLARRPLHVHPSYLAAL